MKTKVKTPAKKAKPTVKPVVKSATKSMVKSAVKSTNTASPKSPTKSVVKPIVKPTAKPITKPVTKSAVKSTVKPSANDMKTTKKTASAATKQTVTKPAEKPATKTILGKPSVSTAPMQAINEGAQMTQSNRAAGDVGASQPITGRGVFAVRTLGAAVSVEAAFLAEDGNVLRLPAVFPNRQYAIEQIDELRALVNRHFDELDQGSN